MGQFRKLGVLVALGALLAPAAPALAAPRHGAASFRPCHASTVARRQRPIHSTHSIVALPSAPYRDEAAGPYPVGYDGSSTSPTGYGVIYNVPPPRILAVRRQPYFPRENGVVVLRGGVVSAAY